jgi:quercetin dioxygenase-like cupin family protein
MSTKKSAVVYRWEELEEDAPMALLTRKRVIGERAMISRVVLGKGCHVPSHAHDNEQFACLLAGKIKFVIGEVGEPESEEVVVAAGEVMHLPPNVPHGAEALEDAVVLDIFSPPSEKTGIDGD